MSSLTKIGHERTEVSNRGGVPKPSWQSVVNDVSLQWLRELNGGKYFIDSQSLEDFSFCHLQNFSSMGQEEDLILLIFLCSYADLFHDLISLEETRRIQRLLSFRSVKAAWFSFVCFCPFLVHFFIYLKVEFSSHRMVAAVWDATVCHWCWNLKTGVYIVAQVRVRWSPEQVAYPPWATVSSNKETVILAVKTKWSDMWENAVVRCISFSY